MPKLDRIGASEEPEPVGAKRHAADDLGASAKIAPWSIGASVENAPGGRRRVLLPCALDVDERGLPLAVHEVLQTGEGEQIVGFARCAQEVSSIISTPGGVASIFTS